MSRKKGDGLLRTVADSGMIDGEVFVVDGKIAGAVPPIDYPNAVPFRIVQQHPGTDQFPAWNDIITNRHRVRIAPEICLPPYLRLFDCLMMAIQKYDQILALESNHKVIASLDGEEYFFWVERFSVGPVVMIDTKARLLQFNPQLAEDGQHRHKSFK